MAIPSLLGSYIDETYQRLVQVTGSGTEFADGLGNPITFGTTTPGGSDTQIQFNSGSAFAGNDSFTFNYSNFSLQQGSNVTASGQYSHAEGNSTFTSGQYSHAEGLTTYTIGNNSHAEGESTFTGQYGYYSTSISSGVIVLNSTANDLTFLFPAGGYIILDDTGAGSIGINIFEISSSTWDGTNVTINLVDTTVSTPEAKIGVLGNPNPVLDVQSTLGGVLAHAEGNNTIALGRSSHTEGNHTIALGQYQHVQGQFNMPIPDQSAFIIGNGIDNANRSNLLIASGSSIVVSGSITASYFVGTIDGGTF